jgi:hypothetical protein
LNGFKQIPWKFTEDTIYPGPKSGRPNSGLGFSLEAKQGRRNRGSTHGTAPANPRQASKEVMCEGALEQAGGVRYSFEAAGRRRAH